MFSESRAETKYPNGNMPEYRDSEKLTSKQREAARVLANRNKVYYMFYGGSRSGKTFLSVYFIRHRARKYAGSKHIIARYSFANAKKTVWLQTIVPVFKPDERRGLCKILRNEGIVYYMNGSLVILGGLEPSRIDSVLAAEYGTIFITEANENKYEDIEVLMSRLNDKAKDADGNVIPPKFIIDLNPTTRNNWTYKLFIQGIDPTTGKPKQDYEKYVFYKFNPEDNIENLAEDYIERLKNLSPSMRRRFYEGEFGTYEGLVFSVFDDTVHVVDDFVIPEDWTRYAAIDFGYTNPFAVLYGAYDKVNEVLYIYREYKKSKMTVSQHAEAIKKHIEGEKIECFVADHDAEDRATLHEKGIKTVPADKRKIISLDKAIDLFYFNLKEGIRPRIKIFRSCVGLVSEIYSYRWKSAEMSAKTSKDREVVKEDDHLIDCMLYMIMKVFPEKRIPGYIIGD